MIRVLAVGLAVSFALAPVGSSARADDGLLYFVEGDQVVFTNTPSRPDARPVPGLAARVRAVRGALPATPYDRAMSRIARENGIDPSLLKAVALVESGMDANAVSPRGAMGLMQLMPETARAYGVLEPMDPYQSLQGGARHLRDLLDEFGGNLTLALAAYNAGSGAVRRHGGVPDYRETRDYVRKVRTKLGRPRARPREDEDEDEPSVGSPVAVRVRGDGSIVIAN